MCQESLCNGNKIVYENVKRYTRKTFCSYDDKPLKFNNTKRVLCNKVSAFKFKLE